MFYLLFIFGWKFTAFVDELGRAVEELVTVITEQEIETTNDQDVHSNQPDDVNANDTCIDNAPNSDSRQLKE